MNVKEWLADGKIKEALAEGQGAVRANPADVELRVVLFELYAIAGQWEKAATQTELLASMHASTAMLGKVYSRLIACEQERLEVTTGRRLPTLFGEPEPWMAPLLHAGQLAFQGRAAAAHELRQNALDAVPPLTGSLNGNPVTAIGDADPRYSFFLEAIIGGTYFWVPFSRIRRIQIPPPTSLRDSIWLPAFFGWQNEGDAAGYIYVRYPGSDQNEDGFVKLARVTDWVEQLGGAQYGQGHRTLATEATDVPLCDLKELELSRVPEVPHLGV